MPENIYPPTFPIDPFKNMKTIQCQFCESHSCFIQQYCSPEWIKRVDRYKEQFLYKQNEFIFKEGSPILGVFFILSGKVKVYTTGINERQQIVRFAKIGHILGHQGCRNEVYQVGAKTMDDSIVCFLNNKVLDTLFWGNPKLVLELMKFYSQELRKIEIRMKSLGQMNIREKVSDALLLLLENFGLNEKSKLNVSFTREDIANIAGTNAEQVMKQLTEFENEGLIFRVGRKIKIRELSGLQKVIKKYYPQTIFPSFISAVNFKMQVFETIENSGFVF